MTIEKLVIWAAVAYGAYWLYQRLFPAQPKHVDGTYIIAGQARL